MRHAPTSTPRPPGMTAPGRGRAWPAALTSVVAVAGLVALAEPAGVVFDVVYDPWPTPMARFADATGRVLVAGLDLLVHQAVLQVELMTGVERAPLEAMRSAGAAALAARSSTGPAEAPPRPGATP